MNRYLYMFNYRPEHAELAFLEMNRLFNEPIASKWFISKQVIDVEQSVFFNVRMDIICEAFSFQELYEQVEQLTQSFNKYKIMYHKSQLNDLSYEERLDIMYELSIRLQGTGVIRDFDQLLGVIKINDTLYFGILHRQEHLWKTRQQKPHSYSNALPVYLARTVLNIAVGQSKHLKLVDPCCGIGTLVIEGCNLGLSIEGYELSYKVAKNAKLNMVHYGYDKALIHHQDMLTIQDVYDIALLDIPYNLFSPFSKDQQMQLLIQCQKISKQLVLFSSEDMNKALIELGYSIEAQVQVSKGYFKRMITICK